MTTPETIQAVEKAFTNKNMSIRRAATGLGISVGTVHKILHKGLKFHPYTLQLLQELKQIDKEKRANFAEEQLDFIENDPDFIKNFFFCDEAHFHLHGGVNRHDYRYWSDKNPHWFAEKPLHSPRVTVFARVAYDGTIVWSFWEKDPEYPEEDGITGRWFKKNLEEHVIPALEDLNNFDDLILYWMVQLHTILIKFVKFLMSIF